MDAKMAIEILHNNQYQKHLGNGEYDYIHPLTDAEVKGIEDLIERQAQEITRLEGQHVFDNSQIVEYEGIVRVQAAKIERQEKMIARACEKFNSMGLCTQKMDACADFDNCVECWRKWLEEAGE